MKWPESVPVIEPGDVCKGAIESNGQRCALGWLDEVSGICNHGLSQGIFERVVRCKDILSWNDAPVRRHSTIARALNRTTALLGYTEGNPEADWAARNRHRFADLLEDVK